MTDKTLSLEPEHGSERAEPPPLFPCAWLPSPGHYTVAESSSIVELATRLGPFTTLRSRLTLAEARLDVDSGTATDASGKGTLDFVLDAASARRRGLRGSRGLDAERHPAVRFVAGELEPRGDDERFTARGSLLLRGKRFPASLRVRVVARTEHSLLVLGTAILPYRALRRATGFTLPLTAPAARLRLLFAAEFTR
ncbi:MAG: YceI family protein [Streptomyces sp.]|nr:YceI family protein [Streptomyces sp.]